VLGAQGIGDEMRCEKGALDAIQELGSYRAWLRRLKGDIDAGLRRFDAAIKVLEAFGPSQGSEDSGRHFKFLSRNEPKGKKIMKPGYTGVGPVVSPKSFKPKVPKKYLATREGNSVVLGQMARPDGILGPYGLDVGCPDNLRNAASGSGTSSP
jgi:hypothetical protein